ncbi:uncharacterized protein METZ01_LOCUS403023, partial [marine metagenome]
IKNHTNSAITDRNGEFLKEFCIDPEAVTYSDALLIAADYPDSISVNPNASSEDDPNGDNWCYNTVGCPTSDYSRINGTEGNGQAMGYRYPDSEDMDNNKTLDTGNNYFTASFAPKDSIMLVTETKDNDHYPTGWKLFRIPLISFNEVGEPDWEDVRSFRLRVESDYKGEISQLIKIAKIELVENDWKELGIAPKDSLASVVDNHFFTVEVINTDESTKYKNSLDAIGIVREHDEYNDIDMKEQSLVLAFLENPDNYSDPDLSGGLDGNYAGLIKNTFQALSS